MTLNLKKKVTLTASQMLAENNRATADRLTWAAQTDEANLRTALHVPETGLTEEMAEEARDRYGRNVLPTSQRTPLYKRLAAAFINPFSEHRDEAAEYLADAWALEQKEDMIMLSPEMNEPVLNSYYEENLQNIDSSIAGLHNTLDKTEDEETRESLQANLDSMKQWHEDYEKSGKYQISPEQIASYRAFGENMAVQQSLIWNTNEGSTQVQQYLDGAMNAQQLAAALEKTLQMQKLEGN